MRFVEFDGKLDGELGPIDLDQPKARKPIRYNDPDLDAYADEVNAKYGLAPGLVKAIKNAGERSNQDAVSPKGARSVMQFMPATAKQYGVNVDDPYSAIDGAGRYLSSLSKRFKGDLSKIVAAYNAGEGNVEKYGGVPPFKETQGYVNRVLGVLNPIKSAQANEPARFVEFNGELDTPEPARFTEFTGELDKPSDPLDVVKVGRKSILDPERYLSGTVPTNQRRANKVAGSILRQPEIKFDESGGVDFAGEQKRLKAEEQNALVIQTMRETGADWQTAKKMLEARGIAINNGADAAALARPQGSVRNAPEEYAARAEYRDASTLSRASAKAGQSLKQQGAGIVRFLSDLVLEDNSALSQKMQDAGRSAERTEQFIGKGKTPVLDNLESAAASIISQAPALTVGVLSGGAGVPLVMMGTQVFGDEYATGRENGLNLKDAAERATIFGAAEMVGERFGIGNVIRGMRGALRGLPTDTVADQLSKALIKEIPGEQLTTAIQFGADKFMPQGLNKEATVKDYLDQAGKTLVQTLMQGGMMTGGAIAVNKGVRALTGGRDEPTEQQPAADTAPAANPAAMEPATGPSPANAVVEPAFDPSATPESTFPTEEAAQQFVEQNNLDMLPIEVDGGFVLKPIGVVDEYTPNLGVSPTATPDATGSPKISLTPNSIPYSTTKPAVNVEASIVGDIQKLDEIGLDGDTYQAAIKSILRKHSEPRITNDQAPADLQQTSEALPDTQPTASTTPVQAAVPEQRMGEAQTEPADRADAENAAPVQSAAPVAKITAEIAEKPQKSTVDTAQSAIGNVDQNSEIKRNPTESADFLLSDSPPSDTPPGETVNPYKPLVEALIKRRAAAKQVGKSTLLDLSIKRAKKLMDGGSVSIKDLMKAANAFDAAKDPKTAELLRSVAQVQVGKDETPTKPKKKRPSHKLLGAIKDLGGIDLSHMLDLVGERSTRNARIPPALFKRGGRTLDDLAIELRERGFAIDTDSRMDNGGVNALSDMIRRALGGDTILTLEAQEAALAREANRGYGDSETAVEPEPESEPESVDDEAAAEREAIQRAHEAIAEVSDAKLDELLDRTLDDIGREYSDEETTFGPDPERQTRGESAGGTESEGPTQSDTPRSDEAREVGSTFELTGETESEIAARESAKPDQAAEDRARLKFESEAGAKAFNLQAPEKPASVVEADFKAKQSDLSEQGNNADDEHFYYTNGDMGMKNDGSFTREKRFWMTFNRMTAKTMLDKGVKPYGATMSGQFTSIVDGKVFEMSEGNKDGGGVQSPDAPYDGEGDIYGRTEQRPGTTEKQRELGREVYRAVLGPFASRAGGTVLGARLARDFRARSGSELVGQTVRTPTDLALAAQILRDPRFETFRVFYTSGDKIVGHTGITSRLPGAVHFRVEKGDDEKTVVRRLSDTIKAQMQALGADGYWMLHNHPSGRATPSRADENITRVISGLTPGFRRHVVIDHNEFAVIDERGASEVLQKDFGIKKSTDIPHDLLESAIQGPNDLATLGATLQNKDDFFTLIARDYQAKVAAIAEFPVSILSASKLKLLATLRRFARQAGAQDVFAVAPGAHMRAFDDAVRAGWLEDAIEVGANYSSRARVNKERDLWDIGAVRSSKINQDDALYTSRSSFERFAALGKSVGTPSQALADAEEITGLKFGVSIREADLGKHVPARFLLSERIIEVNKNWDFERAEGAQYIAEELLHAVDSLSDVRTLSASSKRLAIGRGDIAIEAQKHFEANDAYSRFLKYPIADDTLTDTVKQAELFARLGVLYFGEPELMRQSLPLAYEAFDGIFQLRIHPVTNEISRKVWSFAGRPIRNIPLGGQYGADRSTGRRDEGGARNGQRSELGRLRESIRRHFQTNPLGAKVDFRRSDSRSLKTRPDAGFFDSELDINLPDETLGRKTQRYVQDKFNRVKIAERAVKAAGGKVTERSSPYLAEERMSGRTETRLEQARETLFKPLEDAITAARKAHKLSLGDIQDFLIAKHAKERNDLILTRDKTNESGSGMTNEEADAIVQAARDNGTFDALERISERVQAISEFNLDTMANDGLEPAEYVESLRQWKNYVPLKSVDTDGMPGIGRGFSIGGRESKQALGRHSKAGQVLENLMLQTERLIVRSEKNQVANAFLNMVLQNPREGLWEVAKVKYKRVLNDGEVRWVPNHAAAFADNVIQAKRNGQTYLITVHDPLIARAMKNLSQEQGHEAIDKVVYVLGSINRYFALVNTSLNPEFVITNLIRDIQTAFINLSAEQSAKMARNMVKDLQPAIRGAYRAIRKRPGPKTEYQQWYEEYAAAGGKIGFFGLAPVEVRQRQLDRLIKRADGDVFWNTVEGAKAIGKYVMDLNATVENATRLAAYANARKAGFSKAQAASLAKNLTVNFNRKGELGTVINSLWLFSNASIQGSTRMLQMLMRSKRGRAIFAGIAIGAVAWDAMNRAISEASDGEDEDPYKRITDFEKQRNLIIMRPDGTYYKIPLPYGYNVPYVIGMQVSGLLHGGKPDDASLKILHAMIDSFNPLGGSDVYQAAMPTLADPFVQIERNTSFSGSMLRPEQNKFEPVPDSQLAFRNASPTAKWIAETINKKTGGNEVRPGKIDISPSSIEVIASTIVGGAGRFAANLYRYPTGSSDKMPIAHRFYGKPPEWYDTKKYYENIREVDTVARELKLAVDKGEDPAEFIDKNLGKLQLEEIGDEYNKMITQINRQLRVTTDEAEIKELEKAKKDLMKEFNKAADAEIN